MIGPVRQVSYLVPDLERAMAEFAAARRLGPWYVSDPMDTHDAWYRGHPGAVRLRAGSAYSGGIEVELIQPLGDDPSIYREAVERNGYGLHHVCHHCTALDEDIATMLGYGYELVQAFKVAGDFRIVYLGRPGVIGSYVELIQLTPAVEQLFAGWQHAAAQWDGLHRVHRLGE